MKIRYYQCFRSDERVSMDRYAQGLTSAMRARNVPVENFVPASRLEHFHSSRMVMRYLRYIGYGRKIDSSDASHHHVVDHGYAHLLPRLPAGSHIITVHDLIPLLTWKGVISTRNLNNPDAIRVKQASRRKPWLNMRSLAYIKRYDKIIAVSHSTADDLVEHLGVDRQRIHIVPPVIDDVFKVQGRSRALDFAAEQQLDTRSKWLLISGNEFYKNTRVALEVLRRINRKSSTPVRLLKTGNPTQSFTDLVAEMKLNDLVAQRFMSDAAQMADAYNFVDCLLFPSLYEGFGMPVAEALACGTPVVSSDRGSLPEVGGDLPLRENPYDVRRLTRQVYRCLFEEGFSDRIRRTGADAIKPYRLTSVGRQLLKLYRDE